MLGYFFSGKELSDFETQLVANGWGDLYGFLARTLLRAMLLACGVLAVAFSMGADIDFWAGVSVILIPFVFIVACFWELYRFEARKRGMEEEIPNALLYASSLPKGTTATEMARALEGAKFGLLSYELGKAGKEIERGSSPENALMGIAERNKSMALRRTMSLLAQGESSGAEMSKVYRESAEDLLEMRNVARERLAMTTVQKYTLLAAAGFVVPVVLGLVGGMAGKMDSLSIGELLEREGSENLFGAAMLANVVYLAEFSVMAAVFVGLLEGNLKKAVLYAMFLLPASFAVYHLALGF